MEPRRRIEKALKSSLDHATCAPCPPRLGQAMRAAVFPGGSRFRPEFCLAVAAACGDAHLGLAEASAVAVELLHCASLVYDDLPCFDDAPLRRGHAAVHVAFSEELAILAGNGLIVLAFETIARAGSAHPQLLPGLLRVISRGVGGPSGIVAGQAWESERDVTDLGHYHRAKTGALFESAIIAGAMAGGGDPLQWSGLGYRLGEAYQVADDLRDAYGRVELLGKPVGQDLVHDRPSAVSELGLAGALEHLQHLLAQAMDRVPACAGRGELIALLRRWASQLLPEPAPVAAACLT